MDDISFVTSVGASVVFGVILWWAVGRFQSWLTRIIFALGAIVLGFVVYLALGMVFVVIRPERVHETGLELGHGLRTLSLMLTAVSAVVFAMRGRTRRN